MHSADVLGWDTSTAAARRNRDILPAVIPGRVSSAPICSFYVLKIIHLPNDTSIHHLIPHMFNDVQVVQHLTGRQIEQVQPRLDPAEIASRAHPCMIKPN